VARPTALQSGFKFLSLGNGVNQQMACFGRNGSSSGLQYFTSSADGNVGWFNTSDALVAGETGLFSAIQNGGEPNAIVNATVNKNTEYVGSGSVYVPPVTLRSINYIGKSFWNEGFFQGDIAEVILYHRTLSQAETQVVYTYLNDKYFQAQ
jgi:hypothetical protein